ncbi:hypothetical protein RN001_013614 [Aquatica leii]|uniref:Farnesol dehydrogenase-like n=1 Tax=Aquatica leii TaxID=1421715 RepID=A0AAN7P0B9_9COLE|nr:hypothetical protein RN001_013614 [Aquatica leii]
MIGSLDKWKGKVAVVTGASSGIGAATSQKLVEAGIHVVGLARRKEKIDDLAKLLTGKPGKLYSIKADITQENDIIKAFQWIKENLGAVHILINNAGISRLTTLVDGNAQMWRDVFNTNVLGLCIATREACRNMKENNVNGHIVHVNSFLGHRVILFPNLNVYPASKFAVTALTETLRQELNLIGSKIKISSISPGCVQTEMLNAVRVNNHEALKSEPVLYSDDVSSAVLYALSTPPHVQIHEMIINPI